MAKESGLAWTTCEVDDSGGVARDLKNEVTNLTFATTRGVQDVTGLDKSAHERLLLLGDFSFSLTGVFNDAANLIFDVFKTVCSATVNRTVNLVVSGQTLPNEVAFDNVSFARPASGEFTLTASGNLSDGTAPTWA